MPQRLVRSFFVYKSTRYPKLCLIFVYDTLDIFSVFLNYDYFVGKFELSIFRRPLLIEMIILSAFIICCHPIFAEKTIDEGVHEFELKV